MRLQSALFILCAVISYMGLPARAEAAVAATRCNACSASQHYTAGVNWARAHNVARGHAFVYDVPNGQMKKYEIEREPGAGGTWIYFLNEVPLSSTQASAWVQAKEILQTNGGSTFFATVDSRADSSLPAYGATAYDIALTGAYQNDIDEYLASGSHGILLSNTALTTTALFNIATVYLLGQDVWSWTVTWITADGGRIDFHWKAGNNHTTITRMIDADGNPIPLNEDDIVGQYRIGPGREAGFRGYMTGRFGGAIQWGDASVCRHGITACTRSELTGYHCVWYRCGSEVGGN